MKLTINLSPSPFQNLNVFYAALAISGLLALTLTAYNGWSAGSSWRKKNAFMSKRDKTEWDSAKGREMKQNLLSEIEALAKRPELTQVSFVNHQIERRTLSWTRLLDWMEATMPPAVVVTSIRPSIPEKGEGEIDLSISFKAKTLDAALAFMKRMRSSGAFPTVVPLSESTPQAGNVIEFQVRASYNRAAGPPPPPKDDTADAEGEAEP